MPVKSVIQGRIEDAISDVEMDINSTQEEIKLTETHISNDKVKIQMLSERRTILVNLLKKDESDAS